MSGLLLGLGILTFPGRGQSVNQHSSDGTQRILLFTVDDLGQQVSPEHAVEIALGGFLILATCDLLATWFW